MHDRRVHARDRHHAHAHSRLRSFRSCPTAVDPTVSYDFASATSFIYSGANPVQINVAPGAIDPVRQAVVKGHVYDVHMNPLRGVQVLANGHPELGVTFTHDDGSFDFVGNGGMGLVVTFSTSGYIPVSRLINGGYNKFVALDDVVLTTLDPAVTDVDLDAPSFQAVQASPVTDSDGTRTATILIPENTTSDLPGATSLHIRATEFTVGATGKNAMPGILPPASGYTYAVHLSIDEADAAGVSKVTFSQPIFFYVDNFLDFPVGTAVPTGTYDPTKGVWLPLQSGVVITILSTEGGFAHLDVDGDGMEDTGPALSALGITDGERAQLATTYFGVASKSFWRVGIQHFSDYDLNWGKDAGPGNGPCSGVCGPNPPDPPQPPDPDPDPSPCGGKDDSSGNVSNASTIACFSQVFGEQWDVAGTPFSLHYKSDRVPGHIPALNIGLGSGFTAALKRIDVQVMVAGRDFDTSVDLADASSGISFAWDGKDAYGRPVQGAQLANIRVRYVYPPVNRTTYKFGEYGTAALNGSKSRNEIYLDNDYAVAIGGEDAKPLGLGGLTISPAHVLELSRGNLLYGDGRRHEYGPVYHVTTFAGGNDPTSGLPTSTSVAPLGGTVGPDGAYYFADYFTAQVRKVQSDGTVVPVVGIMNGAGDAGDGGSALSASINPSGVSFGPDGTMYVLDSSHNRVRSVKNGIINAFAGTGARGWTGDGGPALAATFGQPWSVSADKFGNVYVTDILESNVRRVTPDGIIDTFVGLATAPGNGDGGPARAATIIDPNAVAFGPDGSVYITEDGAFSERIRRVDSGGTITTFAGAGERGFSGDSGPATSALLNLVSSVAVDSTGNVYFLDYNVVRVVDVHGIIRTFAGTFDVPPTCDPDTSSLLANFQFRQNGLSIGPDDSLYIDDYHCNSIRKIAPLLPHGDLADGSGQVYVFDFAGRHLATRDERTGGTIYSFTYDAGGRLATITDVAGLVTTIQHDSSGNPTAIVAPFGQITRLATDANGYVSSIVDANDALTSLAFSETGILQSMQDARGYTHAFSYSPQGDLLSDEDGSGSTQTTSNVRDASGRVITRTTGAGRTYTYGYRVMPDGSEETTITRPSGVTSSLVHSKQNETFTSTDFDGTVSSTISTPDPIYGMLKPLTTSLTTTPAGLALYSSQARSVVLSDTNDPFSIVSSTTTTATNPGDCAQGSACAGLITWSENYTASTHQIVTTSPLGRTTSQTIDSLGRPIQYIVPGVLPTAIRYDSAGRVDQVTQGARTSSTTFEASTGWAKSFMDSLGRVTTINARDGDGRVLSTTLPGTLNVQTTFDAAGNLTSVTPPGESTTTLTYTPVNLEASFTPPPVPGATGEVQSFYNLDRQQTQEERPDGSIFLAYDSFGRLASETAPTLGIAYGYDAADRIASLNANDVGLAFTYDGSLLRTTTFSGEVAGVVERRYDNLWRVSQLLANSQSTSFSYDDDGLLVQSGPVTFGRDTQNGRVTGTTTNAVLDTWGFDAYGAMSHYDARNATGSLLSLNYVRDSGGRITQITEGLQGGASVVTSYTYDVAGRLDSVTQGANAVTYGYDPNGNRTQVSGVNVATYDAQDRMLNYGANVYTYTAGGDLSSKTNASGTTSYVYDLYGSLRQATLPDGTVLDYVVDANHRRVGKKRDGVLEQGWLYDGQLRPVAELDGANNIVSVFMYGEKSNVPESMIRGGNTYRIVTDHLGSVRLVVDAITGEVAQSMTYDAWGNVRSDSSPAFQPFGFAGGLYDPDLNLVRFGARDYDAAVGRWTSKDRLRFIGGDTNLYVYSISDPVNEQDQAGTQIDPLTDPRNLPLPVQLCTKYSPQGSPARTVCCIITCGSAYGHGTDNYGSCIALCDPPPPPPAPEPPPMMCTVPKPKFPPKYYSLY